MANEWTELLDPGDVAAAIEAGLDAAILDLDPVVDRALLLQIIHDQRESPDTRLAALDVLSEVFVPEVWESLLDDDDCRVAMRAAEDLLEVTGVDRRPRLEPIEQLSLDEISTAICRLSWSDAAPPGLAKLAARGRPVYRERFGLDDPDYGEDEDDEPGVRLTVADLPREVQDFRCEERAERGYCEFETTQPYDVDSDSPEFELTTSMDWSRYELTFVRRRGRWEIESALSLEGNDCTNC